VQDADYFVGNLTAYDPRDALVLDIENEGSMPALSAQKAFAFLQRVEARTGRKAFAYMSASLTPGYGLLAANGYPLWVASYGSNNGHQGSLPRIGAWGDWEGWQYTSLFPGLRIDASIFKHPIGTVVPVTGGGTTTAGGTPLGRNVSSQSTAWIQTKLNQLGGYKLAVDNVYGPATTAAVIDWQRKHGLQVDGIAGNQTVSSLSAGGGNPAAGKLAVDGIWGVNTTKAMQRVLGVTADGIIGRGTISALQRRLGIPVDGINGAQTHRALQKHVGATQDGVWGRETATKLQQALNAGRF
jgi:peptidoglycan hydrolase-like protein with peptidoglycan-binding domain